MKDSIIIGLLQNTAILLVISVFYDYWWIRNDSPRKILGKIFTGFIIGIIGLVLMLTPWILVPGITFDIRSVVLSLSGLFFGALPTLIAMIITGLFRLLVGGSGVWMGLAVILFSGTIGILWGKIRPLQESRNYILELVKMGYSVHIVMLLCAIFLPVSQIFTTLKTIALPVLLIYPPATILLGSLMFRQYRNWQNRMALEKLNESERRFSEMLKNTLLFSLIIDDKAKITFANQSFLSATGYSARELIGQNYFEFFIEDALRDDLKKTFNGIIEEDPALLNLENTIVTKNGSSLLIAWNNTLLRDEDGLVTGVASIGENITIRKQTETELIHAMLKAEESDRLKSIFLANMSHEIRTPMNAIMGFSNLLGEKDVDDTEKAQYIDIINSSSNRLLQLINDIIDLSKLEAKQLTISNSVCNLREIFINSIESFHKSELLKNKSGLKLTLKLPAAYNQIKFLSDKIRIQQVLDNLISNAIKYTEKGKIEIGCLIRPEEGREIIEISVKDSGIGISEDMSNLVFERFRQVEEGKFHEGAGLGLSISKGIIELMGGKIWFVSEINAGTTFYFTIPYIKPETNVAVRIRKKEELAYLKGKNIIIAEDDYNSYRYLQLLLTGQKANVMHAENGKVLLNMLKESIPDLILLDINMPVMSGFEFLTKMHSEGLNTKIIAQTAYAMPDEKEMCLKSGCHGYISKPIKKDELFQVINSVLSS